MHFFFLIAELMCVHCRHFQILRRATENINIHEFCHSINFNWSFVSLSTFVFIKWDNSTYRLVFSLQMDQLFFHVNKYCTQSFLIAALYFIYGFNIHFFPLVLTNILLLKTVLGWISLWIRINLKSDIFLGKMFRLNFSSISSDIM